MTLSSKRAANVSASPAENATKRPRGDTARVVAKDDAAKPEKSPADNGDSLGRIFVAVRIRPLNQRERESGNQTTPMFHALNGTKIVETRTARNEPHEPTASPAWEADAVFDKDDDNAEVYRRTAAPVVDAVLRGVNGTVMAYGQTSSGKTHTMTGTRGDPGVMIRAMEDIFQAVSEQRERRTFEVKASYMEIYNEEIRDLLAPEVPEEKGNTASMSTSMMGVSSASLNQRNVDIKLINDPKGFTRVIGLEERVVAGSSEIVDLVEEGARKRSVGKTAMNATSSRSHAVLKISVRSFPKPGRVLSGPSLCSTLYVVDLAGSERADPNATRTEKFEKLKKEGSNINQSLLTLRLCVRRLARASQRGTESASECVAAVGHVPYRDSKLTRILQPALAGPGRTAIVAAVTPAASHAAETYSTLNFVSAAQSVALETAKVNVTGTSAVDRELVEALKGSVETERVLRESAEREHERVLEEVSKIGARLSACEARALAAESAREFAERSAASALNRAKAAEHRAFQAEEERDATAAHSAQIATTFMDAKGSTKAEVEALKKALEALESEKQKASLVSKDAEARLEESALFVTRAQEELLKAQREAVASKEAEEAALCAAARELEAADALRMELETKHAAELQLEKSRCAAMKASLERARARVVDAEKKEKLAKDECAVLRERFQEAAGAVESTMKMGSAEKKTLTREIERRVAAEQALDSEERRNARLEEELTVTRDSLARAESNATETLRVLEQERLAAKELEEAATVALGEVERLSRESDRSTVEAERWKTRAADLERTLLSSEADLDALRDELAEARKGGKDRAGVAQLERDRDASRLATERAAAASASSRSFALAAAAAEKTLAVRVEELESELRRERRATRDAELEASSKLADALDSAEASANEARMLKETNEEMMGFMTDLERASRAASAETQRLRELLRLASEGRGSPVFSKIRTGSNDDAGSPPPSPFPRGRAVKTSFALPARTVLNETAPVATTAVAETVPTATFEEARVVDVADVAAAAAAAAVAATVVDATVVDATVVDVAKRGRGRPKKPRTEAEQVFVDLKKRKHPGNARAASASAAAAEKENAVSGVSFVGSSLKSLIRRSGGRSTDTENAAVSGDASCLGAGAGARLVGAEKKRRRLANVSSLRDVLGSPLENGRIMR
jgi:centromeric protein E